MDGEYKRGESETTTSLWRIAPKIKNRVNSFRGSEKYPEGLTHKLAFFFCVLHLGGVP